VELNYMGMRRTALWNRNHIRAMNYSMSLIIV
jgi:hypothetical protein